MMRAIVRTASTIPPLLCFALFAVANIYAQGVDFTKFIQLQDPLLTVTISPFSISDAWCYGPPGFSPTGGLPVCISDFSGMGTTIPLGVDSSGNLYRLTGWVRGANPIPYQQESQILIDDGNGPTHAVATLTEQWCANVDCRPKSEFAASLPWIDVVRGTITMIVAGCEVPDNCCVATCDLRTGSAAKVVISGLPGMFDTLLTFIPSQPALNIQTPAMPDGFRSANSLQVWTGDVRSMPDWSQAQPLTCSAATNPTPGQIVTVPDTLPDPVVGYGRYYITASQSGANRRLGRQYVNGAFSAREPAGLPVCQ